MSSCSIDLAFADGEYTFRLPIPRIDELERKCGAPGPKIGIGEIFARVLNGCVRDPVTEEVVMVPAGARFHAVDLVETIRQGLIGGGRGVVNGEEIKVTPVIANRLVDNYVLDRPLSDSWSMAASILGACVVGYTPPKKDPPAEERATETGPSTTDSPSPTAL